MSSPSTTIGNQTSTAAFGQNALAQRNAYGAVITPTPASGSVSAAITPIKGLLATPTTALKSHSIADAFGNTTTQTYHAPDMNVGGSDAAINPQVNPAPQTSYNTDKVAQINTQLQSLQNQLGQAQGAGYGANDPIQTDVNGNIIVNPSTQTPTNTQTPFQQSVKGLIDIGQNGSDAVNLANQNLTNFQKSLSDKEAAINNTGADLNFKQGAEQVLQTAGLQKQNALETAVTNALAGQNQQINAEQQAGNLSKPELGSYGQTYYQPTQSESAGQITPGSSFDQALNQYAQQAASGQIANIPSSITGNAILNAELQKRARAINPSYTPTTSAAQGSSAADLTGQASTLQAQANGAEANFNLLANIAKQGGVNDGNVPILNAIQQNVSRGLASNEAVVNFKSILQSVRDQYASILGGGTVTDAGRAEALSLIPDDISLSALQSVGQNLKSDATNRISGIQNQVKTLTSSGSSAGSDGTVKTAVGNVNPNF